MTSLNEVIEKYTQEKLRLDQERKSALIDTKSIYGPPLSKSTRVSDEWARIMLKQYETMNAQNLPVERTVLGATEKSVYVSQNLNIPEGGPAVANPYLYLLRKVARINPETGTVEFTPGYDTIRFLEKTSGDGPSYIEGILPEQVIIALADHLERINPEGSSPELVEAVKHLRYTLAYLDKRTLNQQRAAS